MAVLKGTSSYFKHKDMGSIGALVLSKLATLISRCMYIYGVVYVFIIYYIYILSSKLASI